VISSSPTILALETDSAWVVIIAVSVVTLPAVALLRRLIRRPGGFASGVLLSLPLLLPIVAALAFERAVLPEVAVLKPVEVALRHPTEALHWVLLSDGRGKGAYPYALTGSAGPWLFLIGAGVSSFMLCRRMVGAVLVHRLVRRSTPLGSTPLAARVSATVRSLAGAAGLGVLPEVLVLPPGTPGALAVGGSPARILLSAELLDTLEPPELEAIIAHEIAHLEARDVHVVFAAGLLRDMVAWNPVAHLAFRRLVEDRELEADRRAADMTGEPLALASGLLKVCALLRGGPAPGRTAVAILRPGGRVSKRVSKLIALADGEAISSLRAPEKLPYVAAACLVALLGLEAGARIASEDPTALAIVWGAPDASERRPLWTAEPRLQQLEMREATRRAGERKEQGKGAKARKEEPPRHSLQYSELEGQMRVRPRDLRRYLSQVARQQGLSARLLRWEGQRNWSAVPVFAESTVGPLGIYRVEPSALRAPTRRRPR
jgi:Zn-dependent protease with chaperone function